MLQKSAKAVNITYIIFTIVILVAALYFMTDYQYLNNSDNSVDYFFIETREPLQSANNWFFITFVVGIIGYVLLCIFGNSYRKKFYLSNLIVGIAAPTVTSVVGIIAIVKILVSKNVLNKNLDLINDFLVNKHHSPINDSILIIMIFIMLVYIICLLGYIAYTILRYLNSNKKVVQKYE